MSDGYSQPGIVPLHSDAADKLRLRVQAVNASTYVFSYLVSEMTSREHWTIVGYGAAREVSGGFTGVILYLPCSLALY